jgi:hypothetical protein
MTPRKRRSRIYWRLRGGARRAYGDFRDYSAVGGKREALIASGEKVATADPDTAHAIAAARVRSKSAPRFSCSSRATIRTCRRSPVLYCESPSGLANWWPRSDACSCKRSFAFRPCYSQNRTLPPPVLTLAPV